MLRSTVLFAFLVAASSCAGNGPRSEAAPSRRTEPPLARDSAPAARADAAPSRLPAGSLAFGDSGAGAPLDPIFPGTTYDATIPHPDRILRQPLGTFTAHHAEIVSALRAMAAESDRMRIVPIGRTHEGRELISVVIASPGNLRRIDAIRAAIGQLADPRGVPDAEIERLVRETPAVAWLGYSIHGDETSGSDASLAVAHHLAAGTSEDVLSLLREVVVVIDPCQNPDGRERILALFEQGTGYVPNLDAYSMSRGRWPYGRGNHYLFDMNRDWMWGTQPETRARWAAIAGWHPQLLVDAHEMGSSDTFLFYPANDPLTPRFPAFTRTWWQRYASDQAAAFDRHGWSYYTREWADSWYPGYTDSWATFQGACGILYEQARYAGAALRQPSGEIVTYRDAVRRQAVSSLTNVATLAANREAVLRDYVAEKQRNVSADAPGNDRAWVLVPGRDAGREQHLIEGLLAQGVEVFRADAAFTARAVDTVFDGRRDEREIGAGAWIVPARQPLSPLVQAFLDFDPRYEQAALDRERQELERKGRSRAYDVTAWSPAHAYDLDAVWCDAPEVASSAVTAVESAPGGVVALPDAEQPVYGWIVDGQADASVAFAARALEAGLAVRVSDESFRAAGRAFVRGSLLVRRHENAADAVERVARAAASAGVQAFATPTARSRDDGPDLGGRHFDLLARPRVALLSNSPVDTDAFGHVWHLLDAEVGVPCSLIDAQDFGGTDLRRYNVLVVPDGGGSVLAENAGALRTWIQAGGTLIALGSAASAACDPDANLSAVRRRSDVLDDLAPYRRAVERERAAGRTPVDAAALWDGATTDTAGGGEDKEPPAKPGKHGSELKGDEAKEHDRWLATFSPQGAILRAAANPDAWITAGCREDLPVYFEGRGVLLARPPVRTAVRLAPAERLRLSGLVWPEARERIGDAAWCTVERRGAGQVILFAAPPTFRGWFRANARLLSNAVVYGPGAGASLPTAW